jgi:hypothetical protein
MPATSNPILLVGEIGSNIQVRWANAARIIAIVTGMSTLWKRFAVVNFPRNV